MKKSALAAVGLAALTAVALGGTAFTAAPARALEVYNFSFDTSDVAFAYTDGYWMRDHTWHTWRDDDEAKHYRARYAERFQDWAHTHEKDMGWHVDRDGKPLIAERTDYNPKNKNGRALKDPYNE